jgi:hypothetical protein
MQTLVLLAAFVASIAAPAAFGTSTTNYSDQWWNAGESGWGASALQQGDTIFFDIFVYGADTKPTWFTAAAVYQGTTAQGHLVFTGDLVATTGPYYGAGAVNPNAVTRQKVGTLTFDADTVDTATLTYSVNGVVVVKSVTRQFWKTENLAGSYYGGFVYTLSGCIPASINGPVTEFSALTVTQTGAAIAINEAVVGSGTCNYIGTYSQAGYMGTIQGGTYSCSNGVHGTFTASELELNISGLTGRFTAQNQYCSSVQGRLGGLRSTP